MSRGSMRPLSVGNVVSAGFRLYRDRFKPYFFISVRATLWALLPFLLLIPIPFLVIYAQLDILSSARAILPLWFFLLFYCFAKYLANSAIVSRLAFLQLIEQPESVAESRRYVDPKIWIFLRLYLLYMLISLLAGIGFYLVFALVVGGIAVMLPSLIQQQNIAAILLVIIPISIVALFFTVRAAIRFFTRFFLLEVALGIEDNLSARQTIGRSWNLTKGFIGRIFWILTVTFLISLPLYLLVQVIATLLQATIAKLIPAPPYIFEQQLLSVILGYILGLVSGAAIMPLWQTIKAVIYYDLRSRREGLDLQLRESKTD